MNYAIIETIIRTLIIFRLKAVVPAAFIFTFFSLSGHAQPTITAHQNPVLVPNGQTTGKVMLSWDGGPDHAYAEVWQQIDNGQETFVVEQGKGTREMPVEIGKTYVFKLSDFGQLLASVTVTAKNGPSGGSFPEGLETRPKPGQNYIAYLTDVNTETKSSSVAINFWTTRSAAPVVEIGTAPPIQTLDRWVFPAGQAIGQGNAAASQKNGPLSKKVGVKANTLHRFDSSLAGFAPFEPGSTYWYIITGQNPGGQPNFFQTTGSFTTGSQTVKVVFNKIHIIDDSDDLSAADLTYWLWVNYGHPTQIGFARGKADMFTGSTYDINKEFVIQNAPHTLALSLSARDDDDLGDDGPLQIRPPLNNPQSVQYFDENVARQEWDLRQFQTVPGEPFRQEFTLTSMDGGKLQFEIYGYWEITRSN